MNKLKNIVYLYSEVMPYTISVMRALVRGHGAHVDCIYWDQNKRTPFIPENEKGIKFYKRSAFNKATIIKFIEERVPSVIYIVGRMDALYLDAALHFRHKCIIVSGSDNQWTGSVKQKIAAAFSTFLYKRYFEYFWVPGGRQRNYARKMGYADDKIIPNLLTGDAAIFNAVYNENRRLKETKYPHSIVFAGRFAREKGLDTLIAAFTEVKTETQNDWRLILVGSGNMPVTSTSFIDVKGFMTGRELAAESCNWGAFCLPSIYEPWGVVVHEFTMAGLPVICSGNVGAADSLVANNNNGYIFKAGNKEELKKAMQNIMGKSDKELSSMGDSSHELSKRYSPFIAANSLMHILK